MIKFNLGTYISAGALVLALSLAPLAASAQSELEQYSFQQLYQASKAGDIEAMSYLADAYYDGDKVTQNYFLSAEWYLRAAESGDTYSQTNIGYMYERGLGVAENLERAFYWYQQATNGGSLIGTTNLAYLYEMGLGTPQNLPEAVRLYRLTSVIFTPMAVALQRTKAKRFTGISSPPIRATRKRRPTLAINTRAA